MDSPDPWADFYNAYEFQQFSKQHTALHVQTFQPSKRSLAYDTLHNQSEKEQPNINEVEDTTVWVLSSVEASDLEDTEDKEDSDNFSPVKGPVKKCRVRKEWVFVKKVSNEAAALSCCTGELQHSDKTPMKVKQTKNLKECILKEYNCSAKAHFGCTFQSKYIFDKVIAAPEGAYTIYTFGEHNHSHILKRSNPHGIAPNVQEFIKQCVGNGMKPKGILREIRDTRITPKPTIAQVTTAFAYFHFGHCVTNLAGIYVQ